MMENRRTWYDILLLVALYLLSTTNLFALFIPYPLLVYWIGILLRLLFIGFAVYYVRRNNLGCPVFGKLKKEHLLFIPLLVITFSNFIYAAIKKLPVIMDIDSQKTAQDIILYTLVSLAEELVFRSVLLGWFMKTRTRISSIVCSSLVFGAVHLANIGSLSTVIPALIQVLYTFGLGLVLSLVYVYGKNFFLPFVLHFLFNFLNNSLAASLFALSWDWLFYTINAGITVIALGYGFFIYKYFEKKEGSLNAS